MADKAQVTGKATISLRIEGAAEDGGDVRFAEFIATLKGLRETLNLLATAKASEAADFKITNLSHSSPAFVEIQSCGTRESQEIGKIAVSTFFEVMGAIDQEVPVHLEYGTFEKIRQMLPSPKRKMERVTFQNSHRAIDVTRDFARKIDLALGADEQASGSITGHLELVNIHDKHRFFLYPQIGPARIEGTFPESLFEQVRAGMGKWVLVEGVLKYKARQVYPYGISAERIEPYPDETELPTLAALRGVAPEATGSISSEDFIRQIRDAEN